MKDWFINSDFHKSQHFSKFLLDGLTYLFLEKFGGTVMTFDYLLSASTTPLNQFINRCDEELLELHPISLDSRHRIVEDILSQLPSFYNESDGESIGGKSLTSVLKKVCKVKSLKELRYKDCAKAPLHLYAMDKLCPIPKKQNFMIVDPLRYNLVLKKLEEADGNVGLKLWSDFNLDIPSWGSKNFTTAFYKLAQNSCPLTLQTMGKNAHF